MKTEAKLGARAIDLCLNGAHLLLKHIVVS